MLVDPGGGSGFEVDPAQLAGVAGQLGKAYDDFTTAMNDYIGDECYDPAVFGDSGMAAAWSGHEHSRVDVRRRPEVTFFAGRTARRLPGGRGPADRAADGAMPHRRRPHRGHGELTALAQPCHPPHCADHSR